MATLRHFSCLRLLQQTRPVEDVREFVEALQRASDLLPFVLGKPFGTWLTYDLDRLDDMLEALHEAAETPGRGYIG